MAESTLSYVAYDLNRRRECDAFGGNIDWARLDVKVTETLNRHRLFDRLRQQVDHIVEKQIAITCCLGFLACTLQAWPYRMPNLDIPATRGTLPRRRPDINGDVQELPERVSSDTRVEPLFHTQIQKLNQLCHSVRSRCWDGPTWFEGPHLLYRVHRPDSHTFYDNDVGLCCPRWRRQHDLDEPTMQDFRHHVNGYRTLAGGAFDTPYISMTGSPLRALNLVRPEDMSSSDVFVIYSERLWATNVRFERTTTIADRYGVEYRGPRADRAHYITKTHWVAEYWIPADCIIMRMPFHQFQAVCSSKGIFRGTDRPSHSPGHES